MAAGFIVEVFHPKWLANPVLVLKKNGTWRMCVDYTDLNKAYPTDMTSLKKPSTEHDPALKFKSADETKLVDFVPGDSSKQFSISTNLDPK